jgi:hypothetical protein
MVCLFDVSQPTHVALTACSVDEVAGLCIIDRRAKEQDLQFVWITVVASFRVPSIMGPQLPLSCRWALEAPYHMYTERLAIQQAHCCVVRWVNARHEFVWITVVAYFPRAIDHGPRSFRCRVAGRSMQML